MNKTILFIILTFIFCGCLNTLSNPQMQSHDKNISDVEVLLDEEPSCPFHVVTSLQAKSIDSIQSIAMMRAEAARHGLDGIYWVDCSSRVPGYCTSKGFVYDKNSFCL